MNEELFSNLVAIGVNIYNEDGTFRNFSDVLDDVREAFKRIDTNISIYEDNPDLYLQLKREDTIFKILADRELKLYKIIVGDSDGENQKNRS